MPEKKLFKVWPLRNFYPLSHSTWNRNFGSLYLMNQWWYSYENFCTYISQDCLWLCKNDFWPQRSLYAQKKLLKFWPSTKIEERFPAPLDDQKVVRHSQAQALWRCYSLKWICQAKQGLIKYFLRQCTVVQPWTKIKNNHENKLRPIKQNCLDPISTYPNWFQNTLIFKYMS